MIAAPPKPLKAPFPYPGGKSRVADLVWRRLGNVSNYVEPFAGSLAVLLRRPDSHFAGGYRVETANDAAHFLVNFWRAVAADPEAVARWADWPVTEADLHARHKWLVRSAFAAGWRAKMATDSDHFDAKVAGWWVWGQCCWIGSGWCGEGIGWVQPPLLADGGNGVAAVGGPTARRKMPHLAHETVTGGTWVHGPHEQARRPQLADQFDIGRGVNASGGLSVQMPHLGGDSGAAGAGVLSFGRSRPGTCDARRDWLAEWMRRLSDRLRLVRTCYGHWSRVCDSDSTLTRLGLTGVFLDPPYPSHRADTGAKSRDADLYATDKGADLNALRDEVLAWCRRWGQHPQIRVAVCGYEGDGYEPLVAEGWSETAWEANGGYANQRRAGKGKAANAKRERIWWSPACLPETPAAQQDLFAATELPVNDGGAPC